MLHTEAVEPGAFSVLKQLMQIKDLQAFSLVGGTALTLFYDKWSLEPFIRKLK